MRVHTIRTVMPLILGALFGSMAVWGALLLLEDRGVPVEVTDTWIVERFVHAGVTPTIGIDRNKPRDCPQP